MKIAIDAAKRHVGSLARAIFPPWRDLNAADRLFYATIVAANVVPWGLYIWGLSQ